LSFAGWVKYLGVRVDQFYLAVLQDGSPATRILYPCPIRGTSNVNQLDLPSPAKTCLSQAWPKQHQLQVLQSSGSKKPLVAPLKAVRPPSQS